MDSRTPFQFIIVSSLIWFSLIEQSYGQATIPKAAVEGWQEMADAITTLQSTIVRNDPVEKVLEECVCSQQGDLRKCEFYSGKNRTGYLVQIQNKRGFVLERKNSSWQLTSVRAPKEQIPQLGNAFVGPEMGFRLHGNATLSEIPGNTRFTVRTWREALDGSGNIETEIRDTKLQFTGVWTLDPTKRFRVMKLVLRDDDSAEPTIYENEFSDESFLTEIVPSKRYNKTMGVEWTLLSIDNKTLPDSDFSLSYYGVPDFVEPAAEVNWWLWCMLAMFVITFVVFWKTRSKT